ncbi:MAG TPA: response regulator [Thermoanaerobaculia bacterium]|jgi:CheY-like chemotaxis protein|nr:response regulator [Thermoanaerobaculia bacterium]
MSRRILLADDSVTIQKVIELTFMDGDYEVRAVGNGDEAIAQLDSFDPEVVIADVHMPGANGYQVARRAKALRESRPVLLLVGTFEPFDEAESRASGADRFLKKPFDSQELLQIVDDLLASGSAPALLAPAPPSLAEDPFPGLSAGGPLVASSAPPAAPAPFATPAAPALPASTDPFGAFAFPPATPAADAPFTFAEDPPPGVEPAYLPPAEPVWSTFEVEEEGTELPPLPESDLGLRAEPEPLFDLAAEPVFEPAPWTPPIFPAAPPPPSAPLASPAPVAAEAPSAPAAPEPVAAPAPSAPATPASDYSLTDADVERIARRVIELIGDRPVRDVAWEVIPDLAEVVIRDRIRELEAAVDA